MRLLDNMLALNPSLLLWTLTILSSPAVALSPDPLHPTPQLPFQIPQQTTHSGNRKSWLSRVRINVIQTVWPTPLDNALTKATVRDSTISGPPPTILARYGGDLVLRFEIQSIEEAEALAEAVNVLFLDVWEFTTEWVDIRLSKDVVSRLHSKLKQLTAETTGLGTVPARLVAAIAPACSHPFDA